MNDLYRRYQLRVLFPTEIVPYDQIVMSSYRREDIQREPFVGLKVLLKDTRYCREYAQERMAEIDANAYVMLQGSGCIMRESNNAIMSDGIWLVTLPSPRSLLPTQMKLMTRVLQMLETNLGLVQTNLIETCISVRCPAHEVGRMMSTIVMPQRYMNCIVRPNDGRFMTYTFGNVSEINREYSLIRVRWVCGENETFRNPETLRDFVDYVVTKISGVF